MDWRESIACLESAGHPHGRRYRELCEEDADPERRDAYRDLVVRLARGEAIGVAVAPEPPRPAVAESLDLTRRMRACPFRSSEGCGCSGGRCAARGGSAVTHLDCFACLKETPA